MTSHIWPRGVTVSTLDSESSDRGSNPRGTCLLFPDLFDGLAKIALLFRVGDVAQNRESAWSYGVTVSTLDS